MTLLLGTAKIDITPKHPVPLAGFASRQNRPYTHIASRINMRIAHFLHVSPNGTANSAVVVSADLLWWGNQLSKEIREEVQRKLGIDSSSVLLHATHSHSGPQTANRLHLLLGEADPLYLQQLKSQVMDGIAQARNDLEPVSVWKGKGQCDIGIYRRKVQENKVFLKPNPAVPVDPEVQLFRFVRADHTDKAVFVHFAAHPVISQENVLSAEFPGVAMEMIEEQHDHSLTAFYVQGCCGDVNVNFVKDDQFSFGNENDVRFFARKLVVAVNEAFTAPFHPIETDQPCYSKSCRLPLDFQNKLSRTDLVKMTSSDSPYREWAEHQLKENGSRPVHLEITLLSLAKGLSFLAMNAEMVMAYGSFIKQISKDSVVPLPYTNGMIGYIPTAEQIREGGYEPDRSVYYFYLPARLSEHNESMIKKALHEMIANEI